VAGGRFGTCAGCKYFAGKLSRKDKLLVKILNGRK